MRRLLTDRTLKALKPAEAGKRSVIWDAKDGFRGFGVRVTDKGVRSFFVMRRPAGESKPIRRVIGVYPEMSLETARAEARKALDELQQGRDPKDARERERRANRERRQGGTTFEAVALKFIDRHLGLRREGRDWVAINGTPNRRTAIPIAQLIEGKLITRWRGREASGIAKRDVIALVEDVTRESGIESARQTLIYIKRLFSWAAGRDDIAATPAATIRAADLLPEKQSRKRILTAGELRSIWSATADLSTAGYPFNHFVRLLLVLGVRRGELAGATWAQFDLDAGTWLIPRTKNSDPRLVPLPRLAVELLRNLPRFEGGAYLFSTTYGRRPISGFSKFKELLDRRIEKASGAIDPPWILHDLRKAVRTGLSALPVLPIVAELVIGHKQRGIAAVYDLHAYEREQHDALELWSARLMSFVEPAAANVVPIRAALAGGA
jgi:integrase